MKLTELIYRRSAWEKWSSDHDSKLHIEKNSVKLAASVNTKTSIIAFGVYNFSFYLFDLKDKYIRQFTINPC